MKKYLLLLLVLGFSLQAQSQNLVSATAIGYYNQSQLLNLYIQRGILPALFPIRHDIQIYKLIYNTVDADSNPTIASGALMVPQNVTCALPIVSYQHGTALHKNGVPSRLSTEADIGIIYGCMGNYVTMPDYLGLGDGPGFHPYQHAETEASATIDMIRAARYFLDSLNLRRNGQLFLFGYSQGGHATMAAHKVMEEKFPIEFAVTASAPLAGAYDMDGVQADVIISNTPYPAPGYLPYVIYGLQEAYGNIFTNISDIFKSPYDTLIPPLMDGTHYLWEVENVIPNIPNQILQPLVLDSFKNDPGHRLHAFLQDNNLYNWTPKAPVRMGFCQGDMHVNWQNSVVAYDQFIANGATSIDTFSGGVNFDHAGCVSPVLISTKGWFDQFREANNGMSIVTTITNESMSGAQDGSIQLVITGTTGPYNITWGAGQNSLNISGLSTGNYNYILTDSFGCELGDQLFVGLTTGIDDGMSDANVQVYPNPTSGLVKISFDQFPQDNINYRLLNLLGKEIDRGMITKKHVRLTALENAAPGIYMLELKASRTLRKRIVKY